MAANRKDVGRWVVKAKDTAVASAERRAAIAAGFRRLPGFLEQLKPAMAALGDVADQQTPALANLDRASKNLTRFFDLLGPFADASRPAFRSLGKASVKGAEAMRHAPPTIQQLTAFAAQAPELSKNLSIVLGHLDDRKYAAEYDVRAAKQQGVTGPSGYSGLEALLQYVYDQATSTNVYDRNVHYLKVAPIAGGDCAEYADVERTKEKSSSSTSGSEPTIGQECSSTLGPNQPGINYKDPTRLGDESQARARSKRIDGSGRLPSPVPVPGLPPDQQPQGTAPSLPGAPSQPEAPPSTTPTQPSAPSSPTVPTVPTLPGITTPTTTPTVGGPGHLGLDAQSASSERAQEQLLDFLLGR
jgi:hypothetical protein